MPARAEGTCSHYRISNVKRRGYTWKWAQCDLCGMYTNDGNTFVSELPSVPRQQVIPRGDLQLFAIFANKVQMTKRLAVSAEEALKGFLSKHPQMARWRPSAVKVDNDRN